jgi:hypothetical protein
MSQNLQINVVITPPILRRVSRAEVNLLFEILPRNLIHDIAMLGREETKKDGRPGRREVKVQ